MQIPERCYAAKLAGWGRYPVLDGLVVKSEDLVSATAAATLSRGLGRSYGDSSLPATPRDVIVDTTLANRILDFNDRGVLRAEAGVSLWQLNRLFLRRAGSCPSRPAPSSSPSAA